MPKEPRSPLKTRRVRAPRNAPSRRIDTEIWNHHKPALYRLYCKKKLPLPDVIKEMELHNFKASVKQYRYRLGEKWKWPKYKQEKDRPYTPPDTSAEQRDSYRERKNSFPRDVVPFENEENAASDFGILTPSASEDCDMLGSDFSSLKEDFLAEFSDIPMIVSEDDSRGHAEDIQARLGLYTDGDALRNMSVEALTQAILPVDDSIDLRALLRLNASLRNDNTRQVAIDDTPISVSDDDAIPIEKSKLIEKQAWYRDFDEKHLDPASDCILSCFSWCKQNLSPCNEYTVTVPVPFSKLAEGQQDDSSIFRKDVCLFAYLFDLWAARDGASTGEIWERNARNVLGISATKLLRTMTSLILAVGGDKDRMTEPTPRNWSRMIDQDAVLFGLAREGCKIIENEKDWDQRRRVVEFVKQFVHIHDTRLEDGNEKELFANARAAAEAYVRQQWKDETDGLEGPEETSVQEDCPDGFVCNDYNADDESDISEEE
ncbi:hypothetical protein F5Y15DRAFT_280551 [Xylariaceae sp. FL0016]|nr:hypothetical protein F5Y15DRAFT_280551 [Xylariaceae sp. FL0016]